MGMEFRIDTTGAVPVADPALVIAATAARQAATPTARLAARLAERGGVTDADASADRSAGGGSFHGGVAPSVPSNFVKPGFTVAF